MFGSRSRTARTSRTRTTTTRRSFFHRKNPNRQAAGYKAALSNPNTTSDGRAHAKHELKKMGRGREAHVPISTRIKHFLHIRGGRHTRTTRTRRY
ncbi:hypothetical protein FRC03_004804 [Tulasnella sp. 419]|nr:hypothetical protein FRC02_009799 [Tulasnella sp. 418]KAG8961940.1 hypothetical protein FRC03_004804 [Tulasnella sp. 419]